MTILYIMIYLITSYGIYKLFDASLIEIEGVEFGDGSKGDVKALSELSYKLIGIFGIWTAFAFWFIGRQSMAYLLYY